MPTSAGVETNRCPNFQNDQSERAYDVARSKAQPSGTFGPVRRRGRNYQNGENVGCEKWGTSLDVPPMRSVVTEPVLRLRRTPPLKCKSNGKRGGTTQCAGENSCNGGRRVRGTL